MFFKYECFKYEWGKKQNAESICTVLLKSDWMYIYILSNFLLWNTTNGDIKLSSIIPDGPRIFLIALVISKFKFTSSYVYLMQFLLWIRIVKIGSKNRWENNVVMGNVLRNLSIFFLYRGHFLKIKNIFFIWLDVLENSRGS